ncbi:ParA family protein [Streptantibioticus ferralitis]|uniref:ParA family protein n=1 Tax=Streptantibioticus ferralitis TaxID=236510 RepID=A0ABT5Z9H2_9ACTN|nr:ParA family protein [Streptantibioticus ferralitis]MDF2259710.1 ParA family protein [Streptantibioticus ferralitis]
MTETASGPLSGALGLPAPRISEGGQTRIIAMCNQKGGVGKTTTTINLAGALAEYGRRVLVCDCDPQGNSTTAFKVPMLDDEKGPTQATVVIDMSDPHPLVAKTKVENIDVLPASMDMAFLPSRLRETGAALQFYARMLGHFQGEYDDILLDMRPALDTDTDSQTAAATGAIIMVDVDEWAMKAVKMQVAQHKKIMTNLGRPADDLDVIGMVIGRVMKPMGDFDAAVYKQLRNHPRIPLLGEIPVRSADLKEARNKGLPVVFYRPKTDTAGFFRTIAVNAKLVTAA